MSFILIFRTGPISELGTLSHFLKTCKNKGFDGRPSHAGAAPVHRLPTTTQFMAVQIMCTLLVLTSSVHHKLLHFKASAAQLSTFRYQSRNAPMHWSARVTDRTCHGNHPLPWLRLQQLRVQPSALAIDHCHKFDSNIDIKAWPPPATALPWQICAFVWWKSHCPFASCSPWPLFPCAIKNRRASACTEGPTAHLTKIPNTHLVQNPAHIFRRLPGCQLKPVEI